MSTDLALVTQTYSAKETAKLMRAALQAAHPGTKFSVTSKGGRIGVFYTDGPRPCDVTPFMNSFNQNERSICGDYSMPTGPTLYADGEQITAVTYCCEVQRRPARRLSESAIKTVCEFIEQETGRTFAHATSADLQQIVDLYVEVDNHDGEPSFWWFRPDNNYTRLEMLIERVAEYMAF